MAELAEQPTTAAPPRIGKQGDPCVMVIFGAAGDLTGRMLIPALYNLARAGLLSREFAVVGVARTQLSNDEFRKTSPRGRQSVLRGMRGRRSLGVVHAPLLLLCRRFQRRQAVSATQGFSRQGGSGALGPPEFFLLPGDRAQFLRADRAEALCRRIDGTSQRPLAASGHREALRARSGVGQSTEPATAQRSRRKTDLPHRSLSRQRNRTEHHGFPLCQRNLRARLEPPLYRPRADLGGGNRGRGRTRHLFRPRRFAARHGAQPHHATHQPDRHGAADFIRCQCGSR